jgi:hypothetical protein
MTLKGAKKKMKENREGTVYNFKVIQTLKQIRSMLVEIREDLDDL